MSIVFRAGSAAAILVAGGAAGSAQAQTTENFGYTHTLSVIGTTNQSVLLGASLGQSAAQFNFSYEGVQYSEPVKARSTFSPALGTSAGSSEWTNDPLAIFMGGDTPYGSAALPVAFQINGADYAGTAAFTFDGGANTFTLDSVTYQAAAQPVPEPETWAMMILGVGAVGVAARRARRRQPALASA